MTHSRLRIGIFLAAATALSPVVGLGVAPVVALAEDGSWLQQAPQRFATTAFAIDGFIGHADISVNPSATGMTIRLEGKTEMLAQVRIVQHGEKLEVSMDGHGSKDWLHDWLDWSFEDSDYRIDSLKLQIEVAPGTPVAIDGFIGRLQMDGTHAPFTLSGASVNAVIGDVASAEIEMAGSGEIDISRVEGALSVSIAGSGDFTVASAQSTTVQIAGAGDVSLGTIVGGLSVAIAGSGKCIVDNVTGPVDVSIAGSGDVRIRDGRADPLEVSIAGSGDFLFNGEAVNPDISVLGSGNVWLAAYSGQLSSDGADIRIGGTPDSELREPSRAPRVPTVTPVPPVPPIAPVAPEPPATPG